MAIFKWETRSHAKPQELQKVWFCAHPEDYPLYRASITQQVLELSSLNCAFFYDAEPEANYNCSVFVSDLKNKMQLFVMPVTKKLLRTSNRAIDIEFPCAIANRIPVLPIMQEPGLEEEFNNRCGALHFLDAISIDPTAIPYQEKFKRYLESILLKNEISKKIKKAFDAYIFLSYRKMDRASAQEIMRLIHEDISFRDVAIWYDEYLVPGEEFEKNIQKALKRSHLFALAITPNIAKKRIDKNGKECNNYVVEEEYPAARKLEKSILPLAEKMDIIDLKELSAYPNLPPCIDAKDPLALSTALNNVFKKLKIKLLSKNSPEHQFLIGLAYLTGLDIEKNHSRALQLIQTAAHAEHLAAIEKLVAMYKTGEGVERNFAYAIMWQRRVVDYWKSHKKPHDKDDVFASVYALLELGDLLYEGQDLLSAQLAYHEMHNLCTPISKKWPFLERFYLLGCFKLGKIAIELRDMKSAHKYALLGFSLSEMLLTREHDRLKNNPRENPRPYVLTYFVMSTILLGDYYVLSEDISDNSNPVYYLRAMQAAREVTEKTNAPHDRALLSLALTKLGDMYNAYGIPSKSIFHEDNLPTSAADCYLASVEIERELLNETRSTLSKTSLAKSLEKLIAVLENSSQSLEADQYRQELQELHLNSEQENVTPQNHAPFLFEGLHNTSIKEEVLRNSSDKFTLEYFMKQGQYYTLHKDIEAAQDHAKINYLIALEMLEKFPIDTFSKRYRLAQVLTALGQISYQQKNYAEAKAYFLRELSVREEFLPHIEEYNVRIDEDPVFVESKEIEEYIFIKRLETLGDICQQEQDGNLQEGGQYYLKAIALLESALKNNSNHFMQKTLAQIYFKYSSLLLLQRSIDSLFFDLSDKTAEINDADMDEILSDLSFFSKYDISTLRNSPKAVQEISEFYQHLVQSHKHKEFYQDLFTLIQQFLFDSGTASTLLKKGLISNPSAQIDDFLQIIEPLTSKFYRKAKSSRKEKEEKTSFSSKSKAKKEYWTFIKKAEEIYSNIAQKTKHPDAWHELADFHFSIGMQTHSISYLKSAKSIWESLAQRKNSHYTTYIAIANDIIKKWEKT